MDQTRRRTDAFYLVTYRKKKRRLLRATLQSSRGGPGSGDSEMPSRRGLLQSRKVHKYLIVTATFTPMQKKSSFVTATLDFW